MLQPFAVSLDGRYEASRRWVRIVAAQAGCQFEDPDAGDNREHFDYARRIAEQAEAHGVAHLIRQIGLCSDMAGAYLASDFVAVPQIEPPACVPQQNRRARSQ